MIDYVRYSTNILVLRGWQRINVWNSDRLGEEVRFIAWILGRRRPFSEWRGYDPDRSRSNLRRFVRRDSASRRRSRKKIQVFREKRFLRRYAPVSRRYFEWRQGVSNTAGTLPRSGPFFPIRFRNWIPPHPRPWPGAFARIRYACLRKASKASCRRPSWGRADR